MQSICQVLQEYLQDQNIDDSLQSYRMCNFPERLAGDAVHQYILILLREDGKLINH